MIRTKSVIFSLKSNRFRVQSTDLEKFILIIYNYTTFFYNNINFKLVSFLNNNSVKLPFVVFLNLNLKIQISSYRKTSIYTDHI
jgi:hypothetical protein